MFILSKRPTGFLARIGYAILLAILTAVAILGAMIVIGDHNRPPTLESVHTMAAAINMSGLPAISRFEARDGTMLAYRSYPGGTGQKVAVLIHGSAGSSRDMHALAQALSAEGITSYSIDVRGHGESRPKGDISYIGQLEDDLADFVVILRHSHPSARFILVGHSSGGGFALRVAGGSGHAAFSSYILLAPYLRHDAPTSRGVAAGGWVKPFTPRIIALEILQRLGIHWFEGLPVMAFAIDPAAGHILTATYSYRLFSNFRPHDDFRGDITRYSVPLKVLAGSDDEVFVASKYAEALSNPLHPVPIELIDGVNHMGLVTQPQALAHIVVSVLSTTD